MAEEFPPLDGKPGLSVGRTGGERLALKADGRVDPAQETTIAVWQCVRKGVPKRCVIRCDGSIQNVLDVNGDVGIPCGLVSVQYAIGGGQYTALVDCVNQSALVVWAESIQVLRVWDRRRIERLAAFYLQQESASAEPCLNQMVQAAISVGDGDTGSADARWLDVISRYDVEAEETSVHPIPPGARGVRFLNATNTADNAPVTVIENGLTAIRWGNEKEGAGPWIHQDDIDCIECNCALDVPAGANVLSLTFDASEINISSPFFLEWIYSPVSL